MRILVTGSRTWDDGESVENALDDAYFGSQCQEPVTVVHGACPRGADAMAAAWVAKTREAGWLVTEETYPADWQTHGRSAGPRRNAEMVALGADACFAFIRDGSRGATHCAALAEAADIPVRRWTA